MATTSNIRDLQLGAGDPGAFLSLSNRQSQSISERTPAQNFSQLLMQLLQRHQQLGTRGAQEAQFAGQEEQIRRLGQTPSNLIGASPSLQAEVRGAAAGALEPQITGARQIQQTFGEQLQSFGSVLQSTQQLLRDEETRQQSFKEEMRSQILLAAQLGGSGGLESLLKTNPNAFKVAGLDSETLLASVKAKETEEKRRFDVEQKTRGITETDRDIAEVGRIESTLINSKRGGEFVDGNVYLQERRRSRISSGDFDSRFSHLLSPGDKQKYGIGTQKVDKQGRLQELLQKSNGGQNLDSLTPAELFELNSLL